MSRYRFIAAERGHYPVQRRCQVLDVPASGFYAWQQGQQRAVEPQTPAWETALVKVFGVHKRRYGTRRLQVALRQKGHRVGRQRLRTAMRRRGLHALQPKAYTPRTTDSTHGLRCAPNRLLDQPKPTQANRVWVSDITYLPLADGTWAYLCAFQDVASKQVPGWLHARRISHDGFAAGFFGPTAHPGTPRSLRPRRAVLWQRLPATAARPQGPALAEPSRGLLR